MGQFDLAYILEHIIQPALSAVYSWFFTLLDRVPSLTTFVFTAIVFVLVYRFVLAPIFGGSIGGLSDSVSSAFRVGDRVDRANERSQAYKDRFDSTVRKQRYFYFRKH